MPRRMTPDEEAKYHKAQRALIPAIADRGPIGEEYRAAWQGEADRALAVIRRQLARTPDSMSIIDFLVFAPKTLLETFSHATVVVLGEVGDTGETRVGPGERSVHRPVELRIRELLRDARRELVDRPALSVAMYGGTAEVDGGLLATSHVLARPLEKGEWVALFLEARKDGLFNLRFGPQGVIRLGGSDADTVVTLPESLGRLEELRPGRMPQQELLNVLRKTALALPPTEIPVAAIIACARAMTCKNMQRARVMWFDSIKEPVLFFTHATVGYWLKSSDDGTLHVWMTNPEQKSPSHFLQLSGDGGLLAAELGPTTGDPPPGAMTADETAKWHQRHAVFRSPTIGAPEGEQFRVFWQGRVSNALTAIRFVMVK